MPGLTRAWAELTAFLSPLLAGEMINGFGAESDRLLASYCPDIALSLRDVCLTTSRAC